MSVRVIRELGAVGQVNADEARLVAPPIPYFPGEGLRHLYVDAYCAARGSDAIDQPSEVNWKIMDVPMRIVMTMKSSNPGDSPGMPQNPGDWDAVFRHLMFEYGTDGNVAYGGDIDSAGLTTVPAPDQVVDDSDGGSDAPALESADKSAALNRGTKGPVGVLNRFSREVLCRPILAEAADTVRFGDEFTFDAHYGGMTVMDTRFLLVGMIRYEHAVNSHYNTSYGAADSEVARSLNMLTGMDMDRVRAIIKTDTGRLGDVMRTILFGGDTRIEQDTLKGAAVKPYVKIWASFETPYSLDIA